jgi:RecJ-like exonuclease
MPTNETKCPVCAGKGFVQASGVKTEEFAPDKENFETLIKCSHCNGAGKLRMREYGFDHPLHGKAEAMEKRIKDIEQNQRIYLEAIFALKKENEELSSLEGIAKRLANMAGMPYAWVDTLERLKKGVPLGIDLSCDNTNPTTGES